MSLIAVLSLAAASPVCANLHKDFVSNEKLFAMMYEFDKSAYDSEIKFAEAVAPSEQRLAEAQARSRAVGNYVAPRLVQKNKVEEARLKLEKTEEKFKLEGDRITTLLVANKCTPPDHVTSPHTYRTASANNADANP